MPHTGHFRAMLWPCCRLCSSNLKSMPRKVFPTGFPTSSYCLTMTQQKCLRTQDATWIWSIRPGQLTAARAKYCDSRPPQCASLRRRRVVASDVAILRAKAPAMSSAVECCEVMFSEVRRIQTEFEALQLNRYWNFSASNRLCCVLPCFNMPRLASPRRASVLPWLFQGSPRAGDWTPPGWRSPGVWRNLPNAFPVRFPNKINKHFRFYVVCSMGLLNVTCALHGKTWVLRCHDNVCCNPVLRAPESVGC